MSAYWWWIVTFEFYEHPVEVQVTVAAMSESEAALSAENLLYDMGLRGGSYGYMVEQQDRVEKEA